ncbi:hypothetical protein DOE78_08815 [Bacillus sp. Y1]|nr:hypothetical protein DOE78_08815 [Bacillus sp. Y1]
MLANLRKEFKFFRSDSFVNSAVFCEYHWGAVRILNSCVFYTIGTGIGMGALVEGKIVQGLVYSEACVPLYYVKMQD